jgi:predicted DNA-binding protein YlxM (UPF0122 family)
MEITNLEQIELMVKKSLGSRICNAYPERVSRHIEMIRMYVLEEMTLEEVGQELGVSRQAVWEVLQKYGISRKHSYPRYKISKEDIDGVIDRRQEKLKKSMPIDGKVSVKIMENEKHRDIAYDWWIGKETIGQVMATYQLTENQASYILSKILAEV